MGCGDKISAVVLAGGRSSRMGTNKALLRVGDCTFVEHICHVLGKVFGEVLVVANDTTGFPPLPHVRVVQDSIQAEAKGSIVGLYSGLLACAHPQAFVVPVDHPRLQVELLRLLCERYQEADDVLVPRLDGYFEALHAVYSKRCLPLLKEKIESGSFKISTLYDHVQCHVLEEKEMQACSNFRDSFFNINNPAQYEEFLIGQERATLPCVEKGLF